MNEIELKVRGGNQNPGRRPGKERGIRWEGCLNGGGWATRKLQCVCLVRLAFGGKRVGTKV